VRRALAPAAAVLVALAITVALVVLIASRGSHDPVATTSTSTTLSRRAKAEAEPARAWQKQVIAAFTPMVDASPELIKGAREWVAGTRPTEQFQQELDLDITRFAAARNDVANIAPYAKAPQAIGLYRESAQLYLEFARVYRAAVTTPPGDARTQLDVLARRIRELGDRIYDRGTAAMAPFVHDDPLKDVDVRLPEEVPKWAEEGMAPGPPLDDPPPAASDSPPLRAKTRAEQPASAWAAAVRSAEAPPAAELAAAIDGGNSDALRNMARSYIDAAERLRSTPDPRGQREKSAITRLALLVAADGARAAQASTMVDGDAADALRNVGRRLALIADHVWPSDLGARQTGFDPGLLTGSG
jgi:hypothetical protein